MDVLSIEASGLRHLRWGREILASVEAHAEHNPRLTAADQEALHEEAATLRELVQRLSEAVKPYRDFLERTRVDFRARQRVGSFLCEEARRGLGERIQAARDEAYRELLAPLREETTAERRRAASLADHEQTERLAERTAARLRSLPPELAARLRAASEHEEAAALLHGHNEAFVRLEEERTRPLKAAVRGAVEELRGGLERMNERLARRFGRELVESLYPPLARSMSMVADEGDEDDDASAPAGDEGGAGS